MSDMRDQIVVGILGQWASGKSTAAKTLVDHLGGEGAVIFLTDRELLAGLAVQHVRETADPYGCWDTYENGSSSVRGEYATIYLNPGEDLESADLNTLHFDLQEEVYNDLGPCGPNWFKRARIELGDQISKSSKEGKPVVIEAGFGADTELKDGAPFCHTLADFFGCLTEVGVEPSQVQWIIIEASFEKRSERNRRRMDSVPDVEFSRFAADGGDLDPGKQRQLEESGTSISRVVNNHDDMERYKADIIGAFEEIFGSARVAKPV